MKLRLTALALCAALIAGFYALRANRAVMDAAAAVSSVVRDGVAALTGLIPFSVFEVGSTIIVIITLIFIVSMLTKLIIGRWNPCRAVKRIMSVAVAYTLIFATFLWLWCSNYFATPFYAGVLENRVASVEDIKTAAEYFLNGANELADSVPRDEDDHIAADAEEILKRAPESVNFDKIHAIFGRLDRRGTARVKPMLFSELMSRLRYTGIYMALTGESNVNVHTPLGYLPAVAAHELSHSHGVGAEDETNFLGIITAIESDDVLFKYSGYLSGFTYLGNALYDAAPEAYFELYGRTSAEVLQDMRDNSTFWQRYKENNFTKNVDKAYDSYLKNNGQTQGIKSYGACINLLSEWVELKSN
jgi:hypothetical protein